MDTVTMTHPDLEGSSAVVSRKAFDAVWAPKGWELLEPEPVEKPPAKRKSKSKEATSG